MEVLKKLGIDFINRVWPDPGPVGRLTYPPANLWVPDLSILQVNPHTRIWDELRSRESKSICIEINGRDAVAINELPLEEYLEIFAKATYRSLHMIGYTNLPRADLSVLTDKGLFHPRYLFTDGEIMSADGAVLKMVGNATYLAWINEILGRREDKTNFYIQTTLSKLRIRATLDNPSLVNTVVVRRIPKVKAK